MTKEEFLRDAEEEWETYRFIYEGLTRYVQGKKDLDTIIEANGKKYHVTAVEINEVGYERTV